MPRETCKKCLRPLRTCICALAVRTPTETRVTILQHPNEHGHSKNTAHLLHCCLPNSRMLVGLDFEPTDVLIESGSNLLLYPDLTHSAPAEPTSAQTETVQLIVLDGTWRNTRQILLRNTWLTRLGRVSIHGANKSLYHIRKAQRQHQLSTFEATCFALEQLEQNGFSKDTLLHTFQQFVEQIARFLPSTSPDN